MGCHYHGDMPNPLCPDCLTGRDITPTIITHISADDDIESHLLGI